MDAPIWNDHAVDWTVYDVIILRSCWDYYRSEVAFRRWVDACDAIRAPLWNPPATIRWNLDKIYLRDLQAAGVPIVPTLFVDPGESLAAAIADAGWPSVVIKPRVSAAGYRTIRIVDTSRAALQPQQAELDAAACGVLVQPFLPEIESAGEWSFIFLDGRFSHCVLKRAAAGEFRIQEEYGGSVTPMEPPAHLVAQATRAVAAVAHPWLYARVDGCDVDGRLLLMELELIEPGLFLLADPLAATRFARAIHAIQPDRESNPAPIPGSVPG